MSRFTSDYLVSPAEVIEDHLEKYNMTNSQFAEKAGLDKETVDKVMNSKLSITPEIAEKLEQLFHRPAKFWIALEDQFQEDRRGIEK